LKRFLFALALVTITASAHNSLIAAQWSKAQYSGLINDEALEELSGMAASRQDASVLWGLNDGGNPAELISFAPDGKILGIHAVPSLKNIDWEDLASARIDGKNYLLIADTGDNGGLRETLYLHILEEPAAADLKKNTALKLVRTIEFRWPDGARDCESVAIDTINRDILLISKKRVPPELFRIPWDSKAGVATAERLGTLPNIDQPTEEQLKKNPTYGRYRSQITAADLSSNGRVLAVLNYERVYFFIRNSAQEPWSNVLERQPSTLPFPWIPQAEAIAFSADNRTLYIGSEQRPAPLLKFEIKL
jgi:hypothetical protein